jgi:hypothetical protein
MTILREPDVSPPDFVERRSDRARHAGKILYRLELSHVDHRKRDARSLKQDVGIDRAQQAARHARNQLSHGEDLNADFAPSRKIDAQHVARQVRMHDHASP